MIILEIILDFLSSFVFRYIGAFYIWIFWGLTRPYKKILEMDSEVLAYWGMAITSLIIVVVVNVYLMYA